jgi:soluble lytic murein transglycosylase-like protein
MKKFFNPYLLAMLTFLMCAFSGFSQASEETDARADATALTQAVYMYAKKTIPLNQVETIVAKILVATEERKLDPFVILAMIGQESMFNAKAASPDGSKGIMQVHYKTHRKTFAGASPFDVQASLRVGLGVFTACSAKHGGNLFNTLNCYSGGGGKLYFARFSKSLHQVEKAYAMAVFDTDAITPAPDQLMNAFQS